MVPTILSDGSQTTAPVSQTTQWPTGLDPTETLIPVSSSIAPTASSSLSTNPPGETVSPTFSDSNLFPNLEPSPVPTTIFSTGTPTSEMAFTLTPTALPTTLTRHPSGSVLPSSLELPPSIAPEQTTTASPTTSATSAQLPTLLPEISTSEPSQMNSPLPPQRPSSSTEIQT